MSDLYQVITPENVELDYEVAGIGSRFMAIAIDTVIQSSLTMGLFYGLALLGLQDLSLNGNIKNLFTSLAGSMIVFFLGIIWMGYYIILETVLNGQTIGKRVVNIRVRKDLGYAPGFWDILLRNLIRPVDFLPSFYGTGFLTMFLNNKAKRLGDFAAGTIVVKEKSKKQLQKNLFEINHSLNSRTVDHQDTLENYPWLVSIITALTQSDYLLIRNLQTRSKELTNYPVLAQDFIIKLYQKSNPEDSLNLNPNEAIQLLTILIESYEKNHFH